MFAPPPPDKFSTTDYFGARYIPHYEIKWQAAAETTLISEIQLLERQFSGATNRVTPEIVDAFGRLLQARLSEAEPAICQAYARLLIQRVEVGLKRVRIAGSKAALARCVASTHERPGQVPIFERKWCTQDEKDGHSNHWEISHVTT